VGLLACAVAVASLDSTMALAISKATVGIDQPTAVYTRLEIAILPIGFRKTVPRDGGCLMGSLGHRFLLLRQSQTSASNLAGQAPDNALCAPRNWERPHRPSGSAGANKERKKDPSISVGDASWTRCHLV
jgi:hypothetical protein